MLNQAYVAQNAALSPQCRLYSVWQVRADASYRVSRPADARDGLVAVRTEAGCGTIVTQRNMLLLPAQSLAFFRAGDIRQYYTTHGQWDFLWFEFECAYLNVPLECAVDIQMDKTEKLYTGECIHCFMQAGYEQAQYGMAVFAALLSYWGSRPDTGAQGKQQLFQQIVYEINTSLERELTVEGIAKAHHLSARTLRNLFYRQAGQSPLQYIRSCRLHAAREMLESTDMLVKEISAQVGYRNAFYFSRDFKEKFGRSPRHYRGENEQHGFS